jgi:hypothetical protein
MDNLIQRGIKRTGRFLLVNLLYPLRPPAPLSEVLEEIGGNGRAALFVGLATLADYLVWLGWDTTKELGPDGYLHGPYEPWQVVGLVLVLGVIAAAAGWRRHPWEAVIVTTVVMMLCFVVSGAMDPRNDGLFIIGAFMAAVGTFLGVGLVTFLADAFAGDRSPAHPSSGWHRRPWVWVAITVLLILSVLFWI